MLGVKDSTEGLKKLYKMVSLFDLMASKVTEYELVYLLKYDDIFKNITKDLNIQGTKLNSLAGGVILSKFTPSLANLERMVIYQ